MTEIIHPRWCARAHRDLNHRSKPVTAYSQGGTSITVGYEQFEKEREPAFSIVILAAAGVTTLRLSHGQTSALQSTMFSQLLKLEAQR